MDIQKTAKTLIKYLGQNPELIKRFIEHPYSTTATAVGSDARISRKDMSEVLTATAAMSNNQKLGMSDVANIASALLSQNGNSVHSLASMLFGGGNTAHATQVAQQQTTPAGTLNLGTLVNMASLAATLMGGAAAATAQQPQAQPKPTVNQRALFKGSDSPQAGGSEGITGQPGDQGNPNGLAGIKKYDGQGGKGNGTGYDLGGRGAKSLHRPNDDFPEEGIVVVDIWVNREGKVTRAEVATKGTTIINQSMREKAKQAALRSAFASDPNAPEEQHGTITYTFVINK